MIAPRMKAATAATPTLMRACSVANAAGKCSLALRALRNGEAGGDGQPAGVVGVDGLDRAGLERQAEGLAPALDGTRGGDRGAGGDADPPRPRRPPGAGGS